MLLLANKSNLLDVLVCSITVISRVVSYFAERRGQVKIQTPTAKYAAILHTKTSNKGFQIQMSPLSDNVSYRKLEW